MLSARERDAFEFIASYMDSTGGVAPRFDDIARALSLKSKSAIGAILSTLERDGFIRRLPCRARAIEVLQIPSKREVWFRFDDEIKELVPMNGRQ